MTDPTIEELAEIAQRSQKRMNEKKAPEPETLPRWLAQAMGSPPLPLDPDVIRQNDRKDRFAEVGKLRDRLPPFLRSVRIRELTGRISPHSELLKQATTWEPSKGSALLLGDTGTGKTTAAGVMALRCLRDGVNNGGRAWELAQGIRWFRAEELERATRAHPLGRGEAPEYIQAINARLLFLDEAGWERDQKLIASVLATRYDRSRVTVVTSGQTLDELRETYGDAMIRRIITFRGRPAVIAKDFSETDTP